MSAASFVVPVRDGERTLAACLDAVLREAAAHPHPVEVLAVDDGSRDGSRAILERLAAAGRIRLLEGAGRGAAHAMNLAIRAARHPVICQVDQDVVLAAGWLEAVLAPLADPEVAAVQGWFETDRAAPLVARVAGYDAEWRWLAAGGGPTDHVATGTTAYRRADLLAVGLFDEDLGYGADVDLSYRLAAAGRRLVVAPRAASVHRWRETLGAWLAQQLGFGRGRMEVLRRHPRRFAGDRFAGAGMMLRVPATLAALAVLPLAPVPALAVLGALAAERFATGVRAARRFRDPAPLAFPVLHLLRDLAFAAGALVCLARLARCVARAGVGSRARLGEPLSANRGGPAARRERPPGGERAR